MEVESIAEAYGRLEKQPAIRPLELKTFLKVGKRGREFSSQPIWGLIPPPALPGQPLRCLHKCWRKIRAGCAPPCLGSGAPPSSSTSTEPPKH